MRRSATFFALILLTLSLLVGSASVSAKPAGGNNSPNAKVCQKGGYSTLARTESPTIPFTSEEACTSYAAQGGTLTVLLSVGCFTLASVPVFERGFISVIGLPFLAGERVTFEATYPLYEVTGAHIVVNGVVVAGPAPFPAELSYDIPTGGIYNIDFQLVGEFGSAFLDIGCFRP